MSSFDNEVSRAARRVEPIALTVTEACLMLRVSKSILYRLIRTGELESYLIGRRRYIHVASIKMLVEKLKEREGGGATPTS
jgi:excisionase family DNA binding protein